MRWLRYYAAGLQLAKFAS